MCVSIMRADQRVSLLTIDAIAAGHSGDYTSRATNNAASVTLSYGHFGCKRFVIKYLPSSAVDPLGPFFEF